MSRVLVTGGSGFVGAHAVRAPLAAGHEARTTVRKPSREAAVRSMAAVDGRSTGHSAGGLDVVAANLTSDSGWAGAVRGCDAVLHVASPFPATQPKDDEELVGPARDGTLRVLSVVKPELRSVVPQLGIVRRASNEKAKRELGWQPRSNEDAIAATGESLVGLGLVEG